MKVQPPNPQKTLLTSICVVNDWTVFTCNFCVCFKFPKKSDTPKKEHNCWINVHEHAMASWLGWRAFGCVGLRAIEELDFTNYRQRERSIMWSKITETICKIFILKHLLTEFVRDETPSSCCWIWCSPRLRKASLEFGFPTFLRGLGSGLKLSCWLLQFWSEAFPELKFFFWLQKFLFVWFVSCVGQLVQKTEGNNKFNFCAP